MWDDATKRKATFFTKPAPFLQPEVRPRIKEMEEDTSNMSCPYTIVFKSVMAKKGQTSIFFGILCRSNFLSFVVVPIIYFGL